MSLFPAYGGSRTPAASSAKKTTKPGEEEPATGGNWKKNESYIKKHVDIATKEPESDSSSSSNDSEEEADKRKQDEVTKTKELPPGKPLEFDATDGFYVDKLGNSSYRHITTLKKPARPRYKRRIKRLSDREYNPHGFSRANSKFSRKRSRYVREKLVDEPGEDEVSRLQEQLTRTKVLVQQDPEVLDHWLQLHRLLNLNLDKANRLAVAEQQLYNLETALEHHPSNQQILRLYTHVANATYQASEVARANSRKC
ncbi:GM19589 [Drosophila sechellia]|uniref:GM19589 n=1 Tax=Drosophila sechellia TaxID=7238 RepID=B4ILF4_DROSE|nr:GM19589 [Drosophila sechellia]